jgi:hypothetical protein
MVLLVAATLRLPRPRRRLAQPCRRSARPARSCAERPPTPSTATSISTACRAAGQALPVHRRRSRALVAKTLAYRPPAAARPVDRRRHRDRPTSPRPPATFALLPRAGRSRAYVDQLGVAGARAASSRSIRASPSPGTPVTPHPTTGLRLAVHAREARRPSPTRAVSGWSRSGAAGTFFVTPDSATLSDRLLLAGDRGAAAVLVRPPGLERLHRQMSELVVRSWWRTAWRSARPDRRAPRSWRPRGRG